MIPNPGEKRATRRYDSARCNTSGTPYGAPGGSFVSWFHPQAPSGPTSSLCRPKPRMLIQRSYSATHHLWADPTTDSTGRGIEALRRP